MSIDFVIKDKYALGYFLHHAFIALTETLNRELREAGLRLTHPQFTILQTVFRRPGISQRELAQATAKDAAAITRSLDFLEKQGLVKRKPINGCTKGVYATNRADELRPVLEEAIKHTLERAFADIEDEEIEKVNGILQQIQAALTSNK